MNDFRGAIRGAIESAYSRDDGPPSTNLLMTRDGLGEGPAAINPRHAGVTMMDGRREGWRHESGVRFVIATRQIGDGPSSYLMVVLAVEQSPEVSQLARAWRLHAADAALGPTDAFVEILSRYAMRFRMGVGDDALFQASQLIESVDDTLDLTLDLEGHEDTHPASTARREPGYYFARGNGGPPFHYLWSFVIDETFYAEDVAHRRRSPN